MRIGRCIPVFLFIVLFSCGQESDEGSSEPVSDFVPFYFGNDLSYVNQMEDCGAEFKVDGQIIDPYKIYADYGCNLVRVRLWHNPNWQGSLEQPDGVKSQYSDLEDVIETITRSHQNKMSVLLDFHYSDIWADPQRQAVPEAWRPVANDVQLLKDSLYNYTYAVLKKLNDIDQLPTMVQIGNEINPGLLVHESFNEDYSAGPTISQSWDRHAILLNAGIKAVRDLEVELQKSIGIVLHAAGPENSEWFFDLMNEKGVKDFDIMGLSYYYAWHGGSIEETGVLIEKLRLKYPQYELIIVETGYPWDQENIDSMNNIISELDPKYTPASPAIQKEYLIDLTKEVIDSGGLGLIFWESAWVSTECQTPWGKGSAHEHVVFFDHRNNLNLITEGGVAFMDPTQYE